MSVWILEGQNSVVLCSAQSVEAVAVVTADLCFYVPLRAEQ